MDFPKTIFFYLTSLQNVDCDGSAVGKEAAGVEIVIHKEESRNFLQVGKEMIEVSDYSLKSSADGSTELSVTIKGKVNVFETSANLIM